MSSVDSKARLGPIYDTYPPPHMTHMYPPPHMTHMYPPPHMTHMYPPPHMTHMYPPPHMTHDSKARLGPICLWTLGYWSCG